MEKLRSRDGLGWTFGHGFTVEITLCLLRRSVDGKYLRRFPGETFWVVRTESCTDMLLFIVFPPETLSELTGVIIL